MASGDLPYDKLRPVLKQYKTDEPSNHGSMKIRGGLSRVDHKHLDPFLLLDEAVIRPPGGFGDHPHRGFETVTYVLEGAMAHEDCEGHKGILFPGDVQWMTAGRGILHSEFPATRGDSRGLQLWVNLAAKDKMVKPIYQEMSDAQIPRGEKDGVTVKVIAGESLGVSSPVRTLTPAYYLDVFMQPGSVLHQHIPEGWNSFAYVLEGEASFSRKEERPAVRHSTVVLGPGNGVSVWNNSAAARARFILIAGKPLNEPVAQSGPMVMNTRQEVQQAMMDFQYARNGFEKAVGWSSARDLRVEP